jgi:hypothetical protein
MNLKKLTYKNFREGLHKVTPLELCNARIAGYFGTIIGGLLAMIPMVISGSYGWIVFIFFMVWLQVSALIGDIQQRKILKDSEDQIASAMAQMEKINLNEVDK